jgi:hypothetical protein
MPSHGRGVAIISVIVVVACLGGCGGGAKTTSAAGKATSSSTSSDAPGKAADSSGSTRGFIARADAICRETNAKLARTQPKGESPDQVAAAVVENETIERKANGRLAQLTPPATLAPTWSKMLGYRRSLANQLGSLAAATRNHATASVTSLGGSKKKVHGELRRLATNAGFKDCAKVGSR